MLLASGLLCLSLAACGKEEEPILEVTPISVTAEESGTSIAGKKTSEEETLRREESAEGTEYLTNGEALTEGNVVKARGAESLLQEDGETLETRVLTPAGYERGTVEEGSFEEFLRQYPMQPAGAKVHLYDGTEKGNQSAHVAVFALPIEEYDLQQCADSVMRMYAEYFWATEQYDRIKFHVTNGLLVEYSKWREGSRVTINGNNVSWIKSKSKDTSYECFVRYLRTIFCYAGTLSMEKESGRCRLVLRGQRGIAAHLRLYAPVPPTSVRMRTMSGEDVPAACDWDSASNTLLISWPSAGEKLSLLLEFDKK